VRTHQHSEPARRKAGPAASPRREKRRSKNLAIQIRQELLAEIWAGRWRPGDQIPTEIELMARFGVSRTPIREAMQSLHLMGIVDIAPRRGSIVRALPVESVVDLAILSGVMEPEQPITDVFEFRDAIESAAAELAARNASDDQIESLRAIVAENEAAVARGDDAEAQSIDVRFHAKIAEASRNAVFQAVTHTINGLLVELRRVTSGVPGAPQAAFAEHGAIFRAVEGRDGPAARQLTQRHIRNSRARYESARVSDATDRLTAVDRPGVPDGGSAHR
jgi:GntR family transcriptional regulator, transcriptional repressor for pyruvate dehydrogenase complex